MSTYSNPFATFDSPEDIVRIAEWLAVQTLEADGNKLDDAHRALVNAILWTLADTCIGKEPGRVAVPADTGLGKSTCLSAFIAAVGSWAVDTPLLVLTARIEEGEKLIERACAMAELIGSSMQARVRSRIAHVHSKSGGLRPDDPEAAEALIVVATHSRAQLESIRPLLRFDGEDGELRGIVIDEALHKAEAFGLSVEHLRKALGYAKGELRGDLGRDLDTWANAFEDAFETTLKALQQPGGRPFEHIEVPAPESVASLVGGIKARKKGEVERDPDNLIALLEHAAVDPRFRVLSTGVIQHRRVLPAEFDDCVILDATSSIDALGKLDDHFQLAHERSPDRWAGAPWTKDWELVHVERMAVNAGRSTMDEQTATGGWLFKAYIDKLVELLTELPPEDFVLVCVFKPRSIDTGEKVRAAITERLGHAALARLRFIWFGQHDASSEFRDAAAVVAMGEWNVSRLVATAAALGAMEGGPDAHVDIEKVNAVLASHVATSLVQLAGRGRCRKVVNGKAQSMRFVYASANERVNALVSRQMKGAQVSTWEVPEAGRKALESKRRRTSDSRAALAADAVEYLQRLEREGVSEVSAKRLWQDLNAVHIETKERQRALEDALNKLGGWARDRQSVVLLFPKEV